MVCNHPAVVSGKCLTCGAVLNAHNAPNKAAEVKHDQTPVETAGKAAEAQKTPKKTTGKRKA